VDNMHRRIDVTDLGDTNRPKQLKNRDLAAADEVKEVCLEAPPILINKSTSLTKNGDLKKL